VHIVRKRIIVGTTIAATSWYAFYRTTRWVATWGVTAGEAAMVLPGDALVPEPTAVDTRAITIDAPPDRVWPWLVQMGYGRGGWYSYDRLDMRGRSADRIVPAWQSLAVGDVVPTDPGGGFVVRSIDPRRSLVLGVDEDVLAARRPAPADDAVEPGLAASGAFLERAVPPAFRATWAFVLEPVEGGRTRLIERFRAWTGPETMQPVLAPILGLGVFVMVRRQLLGIRDRAERRAAADAGRADADVAPGVPERGTDAVVDPAVIDELRVLADATAPSSGAVPG
jgi:hypothetical protein